MSFFSHFIFKRLSPLFFSTLLTSSGVRLLTFYIQEAFSSLYPPFFYAFNFFHCPSFHILDPRGFLLFIPPFLSISGFNFFKLSSFYSFPNCFGIHKFQNPIYFISAQPIPHTSRLHSVTSTLLYITLFTLHHAPYNTLLTTISIYNHYYSRGT